MMIEEEHQSRDENRHAPTMTALNGGQHETTKSSFFNDACRCADCQKRGNHCYARINREVDRRFESIPGDVCKSGENKCQAYCTENAGGAGNNRPSPDFTT